MRYSPWDHLEAMPDVTFGIHPLPAGDGWWLPEQRAIVLDPRLSQVERRTVLAHELVHAERNDQNCHHDGRDGARQARRQEAHADKTAALRLISIDQLVDALRHYPLDPALVADCLGVTQPALTTRLRMLTDEEKSEIEARLADLSESYGA